MLQSRKPEVEGESAGLRNIVNIIPWAIMFFVGYCESLYSTYTNGKGAQFLRGEIDRKKT